jgi:hypothetical protein
MKLNKKELQKALKIVKPALANTELIEQSTSFAFLEDCVVTYNDSISISHPVEGLELRGAVRAEELYQFLDKIDQKEIQMKLFENEIKLKAKNSKAGLRLEKEIKLPLEEKGDIKTTDWQDLPEEFISDLRFISDSASRDLSRRVLTCVHVKETYMEASDSFQIMQVQFPNGQFPYPGVLIPAENINDIAKVNPIQIYRTEGWVHFRNPEGTVISSRVLIEDYPDTSDHFDVDGSKVTFPKKMQSILDRVMVFTEKDDIKKEAMSVKLKDNMLRIEAENDKGSWIEEKAKVDYKGPEESFWVSPQLLKNILNRSSECSLGKEKIKFTGDGWQYVAVLMNQ